MFGKYGPRNRSSRRHAPAAAAAAAAGPTEEELAAMEIPAAAHPRFLKLKPSPKDERDLKFNTKTYYSNLPASVDMTSSLPPALDQGQIGSCSAHASGLALRFLYSKQLNQNWMPSRLALYYVTRVYMTGDAPEDDSGCILRDVCKAVAKYQLPPEMYWRYDTSKFALPPPFLQQNEMAPAPLVEYRAVARDEYSLKVALSQRFPIILGIALYDSFVTPTVASTGVVPMPNLSTEECIGGHAVLLVGFTSTNMFIVRNSWSASWGKAGNFTLPVAYLINPDLCFDAFVLNRAIEM